jgi:hypothetical protein
MEVWRDLLPPARRAVEQPGGLRVARLPGGQLGEEVEGRRICE